MVSRLYPTTRWLYVQVHDVLIMLTVADRFTLKLINNQIFKPEDFYTNPKGGGVYLKRKSMKRYFVEYEKKLNEEFEHPRTGETTTLRKCFRIQAESLAATIQNKAEYVPYTMNI